MDRRDVLKAVTAAGIGSAVFGRALQSLAAEAPAITPEMIKQAEWISGISMSDAQRKLMQEDLKKTVAAYASLRRVDLPNAIPPAFTVNPHPGAQVPRPASLPGAPPPPRSDVSFPSPPFDAAFAPIDDLVAWLRTGSMSSTELTKFFLDRIERLDQQLHAVVTPTRELALRQAAQADADIKKGNWRGPLHGIPYAAKDLIAAKGYPTTWGSPLYKTQTFDTNATVIDKLEAAGAVLLAKTAVGELAWGDVWFGGMCRNPWKLDQGSSGSSAGSASLVAAGCVPFAIGTETWGSIVSPSTRCGATGLRPTFGRVSRAGVMALAWTMDKVGPIARTVGDCALVFQAIQGADPADPYSRAAEFTWPISRDPKTIRVGYVKPAFEFDYTQWADPGEDKKGYEEWKANDAKTLEKLRAMGYQLQEVDLKFSVPIPPLSTILTAEAAATFDALTRDGRVDKMVRQTADAWPNTFRGGELIPAVEYIRAQRLRTVVMREMAKRFDSIDVYVVPSFADDNQLLTNLTGHPAVVLPNGFRSDGTPTSITFQGPLDREDLVLAVAQAFQEATDFHRQRPPI